MEDENREQIERMNIVVDKLLSNVPSPELIAAAKEDFTLLIEYSHVASFMWKLAEHFPDQVPVNKQLDMLAMLTAAYTMGYRKGKAATPLTLVVAPDERGL